MRKSFKSAIGTVLGILVVATAVEPAHASMASGGTEDDLAAQIIEASVDAASGMRELGITSTDFRDVPAADQAYFDQVAELALVRSDDPFATFAETNCSPGERAVYAANIAAVNSARDSNARTAAEETMYMYLSHYIDMAPSLVGTECGTLSESQFYSAWITNQDRQTYDQFLATVNATGLIGSFSDGITSAVTLTQSPAAAQEVIENAATLADFLTILVHLEDTSIAVDSIYSAANELELAYQAGSSAEAAVARALAAIEGPDLGEEYWSLVVGVAAALLAPTAAGALLGVGFAMVPTYVMLGTTIIDMAALAGMRYTSKARAVDRMMRYYGM